MTRRAPALDLPQITVACPAPPVGCGAPAGELCTSHGGSRPRRSDTHIVRRAAWAEARKEGDTA